MTNEQILSLDRCRDFYRSLNKASGEIKSILLQLNAQSSGYKGNELGLLAKELDIKIIEQITDCQRRIDKMISEI